MSQPEKDGSAKAGGFAGAAAPGSKGTDQARPAEGLLDSGLFQASARTSAATTEPPFWRVGSRTAKAYERKRGVLPTLLFLPARTELADGEGLRFSRHDRDVGELPQYAIRQEQIGYDGEPIRPMMPRPGMTRTEEPWTGAVLKGILGDANHVKEVVPPSVSIQNALSVLGLDTGVHPMKEFPIPQTDEQCQAARDAAAEYCWEVMSFELAGRTSQLAHEGFRYLDPTSPEDEGWFNEEVTPFLRNGWALTDPQGEQAPLDGTEAIMVSAPPPVEALQSTREGQWLLQDLIKENPHLKPWRLWVLATEGAAKRVAVIVEAYETLYEYLGEVMEAAELVNARQRGVWPTKAYVREGSASKGRRLTLSGLNQLPLDQTASTEGPPVVAGRVDTQAPTPGFQGPRVSATAVHAVQQHPKVPRDPVRRLAVTNSGSGPARPQGSIRAAVFVDSHDEDISSVSGDDEGDARARRPGPTPDTPRRGEVPLDVQRMATALGKSSGSRVVLGQALGAIAAGGRGWQSLGIQQVPTFAPGDQPRKFWAAIQEALEHGSRYDRGSSGHRGAKWGPSMQALFFPPVGTALDAPIGEALLYYELVHLRGMGAAVRLRPEFEIVGGAFMCPLRGILRPAAPGFATYTVQHEYPTAGALDCQGPWGRCTSTIRCGRAWARM